MTTLILKLKTGRSLQVMPDTIVEMDGHPIISYTYSLFLADPNRTVIPTRPRNISSEDYVVDPDYLGFITFERDEDLFSYTPSVNDGLTYEEVQESIAKLNELRSNPETWNAMGNF